MEHLQQAIRDMTRRKGPWALSTLKDHHKIPLVKGQPPKGLHYQTPTHIASFKLYNTTAEAELESAELKAWGGSGSVYKGQLKVHGGPVFTDHCLHAMYLL